MLKAFLSALLMLVLSSTVNTKRYSKDLVRSLQEKYHVPVAGIGVIENGKIIRNEVHGILYDWTPAPLTTLFNIASLTNPLSLR